MLPPPKPCAAGTHRALEGLWECGTATQLSPLWSSVLSLKAKKKPTPKPFRVFLHLGKSLPRDAEQAEGEMSTPCPPALRDQSRAEASGPCHPCPEASKGIQVALEKWRKAEERQAATKAACCHKVRRLPWGIALLQPSPPYSTSGVWGVRAPGISPASNDLKSSPLSHHSSHTPKSSHNQKLLPTPVFNCSTA